MQEDTVCDYLNWLIRELLLNAIIHRDYQIGNAPVKFYEYNNRIEISNPGGLYGQATPENFPYVNDYRNPLLAEAMKIMGYVNKFNRGIAKVKNELERNGNPLPVFDYNKRTEFRVTLCPANGEINGEITTSNGEINGEMKILEAITENPGIKRDRLRSITGISLRTIDRIVKRLTDDEKIEYRGSKRT